jgi:hypothetical protein
MSRDTDTYDGNERPDPQASSSATPLPSVRPDGLFGPQTRADASPTDHAEGDQEFIAKLKQGLEATRLPANLREQILAQLPTPEEQERLYREMQEKGGMSFDQFMESLGLEVHPQP